MENWLGVEVRHLAALSAIHAERSFRGAADRLGYVQSAVSQQISQLEALVGMRLVNRARGHAPPVHLTEAGLLLVDHADHILAQLDAAQADVRSLGEGEVPVLRIGVEQSVATQLLAPTLTTLARACPSVRVVLDEATSDRAHFDAVEHGELDAAFAELPLEDGPFAASVVLEDPPVLIVQASSPLALQPRLTELEQLVSQPLIGLRDWPMMKLIESHLRSSGLEPRFAMQTELHATAQALAGVGVGAAILPRLAVNEHDPQIAVVELGELLPARRLALYWHTERRELGVITRLRDTVLASARVLANATRAPRADADEQRVVALPEPVAAPALAG